MILLDTHAWIWYLAAPERLSGKARKAIEAQMGQSSGLVVSSISAWELAMLVDRGRLRLTIDADTWVARAEALPFLRFVPVDNRIALASVRLPPSVPPDPADRIIVATALLAGIPLVTADKRLRKCGVVKTIW
ncbi:MAG: type II toxin-antitoxin system VapC family toxin [Deltaproteobacteria bacterium]|nr:type II toxin-antitoxin system VapC family toxin [Deltaproteobacteria bacterium]